VTDEAKLERPQIGLAQGDVVDEVARAHAVVRLNVAEERVGSDLIGAQPTLEIADRAAELWELGHPEK
jgi:hypothetical protein